MIKKHWFCFSYVGSSNDDGGATAYGSAYVGYLRRGVTRAMIEENKGVAGLSRDAVLVSVSYLGKMTRGTFVGQEAEA